MTVQRLLVLQNTLALVLGFSCASTIAQEIWHGPVESDYRGKPNATYSSYCRNIKAHSELASEWQSPLFVPVKDLPHQEGLNAYLYLFPSDVDADDEEYPSLMAQHFQDWNDLIWQERLVREQSDEKYDLAERIYSKDLDEWGTWRSSRFYSILWNRPAKVRLVISDQQYLSSDMTAGSLDVNYGIPVPYDNVIEYLNRSWRLEDITLKFKSLKGVDFQGMTITDSSIYLEDTAGLNFRGALLINVDLHGPFSFHQLSSTDNGNDLYTMFDDVKLWMDEVPDDWHEEAWLNYNPQEGVFDVSRRPHRAIPAAQLDLETLYLRDNRHSFLSSLDALSAKRGSSQYTSRVWHRAHSRLDYQYRDLERKFIPSIEKKSNPNLEIVKGDVYFILPNETAENFLKLKKEMDGDLSNFIFFPDESRESDREYSLEGWDLSNLDLTNAKLQRLNLTGVDFTNSIISFCSFEGSWGLTVEQLKNTWNWKTGKTSDIIFPKELLEDPEFKNSLESP